MKETPEIKIMRHMAWERAKGELKSVMSTYCSNDNYAEMNKEVKSFIDKVEDNGLKD